MYAEKNLPSVDAGNRAGKWKRDSSNACVTTISIFALTKCKQTNSKLYKKTDAKPYRFFCAGNLVKARLTPADLHV